MVSIPWGLGRLRGRGEAEVVFGFQHEDGAIEASALEMAGGGRAVCVCSGGEVAFELLRAGAEEVIAVDINPAQGHVVRLKLAAIEADLIPAMTGNASSIVETVVLGGATRRFWRHRTDLLNEGVCFCGIVERRTLRLGPFLRWMTRGQGGLRWRLGWALLGWGVRFGYRSSFRCALPEGWRQRLQQRIERAAPDRENPWWAAELGNKFGRAGLPIYQPENVSIWRQRTPRLQLVTGELGTVLEGEQDLALVALSNVMDTLHEGERQTLCKRAVKSLRPGGKLVLRSMLFSSDHLPQVAGIHWQPTPKDRGPVCPVWGLGTKG